MHFLILLLLALEVAVAWPITFNASYPFQWGLATAPAHVEDALDDSWWEWASEDRIPFVLDQGQPSQRLRFWSDPQAEIDLISDLGVQVRFFLSLQHSHHDIVLLDTQARCRLGTIDAVSTGNFCLYKGRFADAVLARA